MRAVSHELLWRALYSHRRDLLAASLLFTGYQVGESMVPVIIGALVGHAIAGSGAIAVWLAVLGADFAFLSLCYRFGARASMRARQGSAHQARLWLAERVLSPDGGITLSPGELVFRANSDCTRVGMSARVVAYAVDLAVVLMVATGVLLALSPVLGAVILVGTPVLLLVQHRASASVRRRAHAEQAHTADASGLAEDLIRGLRVLKGIGATETAAAHYQRRSGCAIAAALRSARTEALLGATGSLLTGVYLAVIVGLGGWLALTGHLGLGPLVSALGLARFLIDPMESLATLPAGYARALASATRVQEVISTPVAVSDGVYAARPGRLDIEFARVPGESGPVSFTARTGRLTGIVAGTPADAAMIAALLARERDPVDGAVTFGGINLRHWKLSGLRGLLLVAPHDAALLPGTIAENIGVRAASHNAIARATAAAVADQVIEVRGAHAEVGDRGQHLSGGQRQRVTLARALAADPDVLVLHDPTTSVDAATEVRIAARLRAARAGRTTILLTASHALLARCDEVIQLAGPRTRPPADLPVDLVAADPVRASAVST
jgi:putative ABC transport system ATP-binding protein